MGLKEGYPMNTKDYQTKFEAYLLTEKRVAKNTFLSYQKDLNQFIDFLQGNDIYLQKVISDDLKNVTFTILYHKDIY